MANFFTKLFILTLLSFAFGCAGMRQPARPQLVSGDQSLTEATLYPKHAAYFQAKKSDSTVKGTTNVIANR